MSPCVRRQAGLYSTEDEVIRDSLERYRQAQQRINPSGYGALPEDLINHGVLAGITL